MKEPTYYTKNGLSPINAFKQGLISKEMYKGFIVGNIIKYIVRCEEKHHSNPLKDLEKAEDYLQLYKEIIKDNEGINNYSDKNHFDDKAFELNLQGGEDLKEALASDNWNELMEDAFNMAVNDEYIKQGLEKKPPRKKSIKDYPKRIP